jgi:hypothetical protein
MALRELNIKIGANAQALDKELTRIGRRLAAFSKQMQQIGSDLTQSLSLPLAGVSAGALTAFAGMERLEKGLTAVMGSSEAAAVELEKLKKSAQLPGLGFEEAVKGSIDCRRWDFRQMKPERRWKPSEQQLLRRAAMRRTWILFSTSSRR